MKRHYLAMPTSTGRGDVVDAGAPTQRAGTAEIQVRQMGPPGTRVVDGVKMPRERRMARAPGASAGASPGQAMRPAGGMHTLVLIGELDRASAHTLEAEIEHLCESGTGGITLDLSKLSYIDSTGVAVVAFRSRLCQKRGYEFALIPGSWLIQQAFELAGLVEHLPFIDP